MPTPTSRDYEITRYEIMVLIDRETRGGLNDSVIAPSHGIRMFRAPMPRLRAIPSASSATERFEMLRTTSDLSNLSVYIGSHFFHF